MRHWLLRIGLLAILVTTVPAFAQTGSTTPYAWEAGDLALAYPIGWDAPISAEEDGRLQLTLAQTLADSPDIRPQGVPFIVIGIVSSASDPLALLQTEIEALTLTAGSPSQFNLLGEDSVRIEGVSADGLLYGIGVAVPLSDEQVLIVAGRALAAQQDSFALLFDEVVNSVTLGAGSTPRAPEYGVLWATVRTLADGPDAFIRLGALEYGPDDQLYTADIALGVVQLDAASGSVTASFPNAQLNVPGDMAVTADGTVYTADIGCACVHVLTPDDTYAEALTGFGVNAPRSITAVGDALYATDVRGADLVVRVYAGGDEVEVIALNPGTIGQPLLFTDRTGQVQALSLDGEVFALQDGAFTAIYGIGSFPGLINDVTVDLDNNLVLATDNQGIVIVAPGGTQVARLGTIVPTMPLPGDVVNPRGVAVSPDGTLFWTDSDGTFGAVTAVSTRVAPGRLGATELMVNSPVQGRLDGSTPQQVWIFTAQGGETLTFSAVDLSRVGAIDLSMRLIAPDGTEVAANDNHELGGLFSPLDAQLANITLDTAGTYTVLVQAIGGAGVYGLGVSALQPFTLDADGTAQLEGALTDPLPTERWTFEAQAGQVVTITQRAGRGSLDTLLRLRDVQGEIIAENDDAADPALGRDAQIVNVPLPADGLYTIEASRFDGEGSYTLTVVVNAGPA